MARMTDLHALNDTDQEQIRIDYVKHVALSAAAQDKRLAAGACVFCWLYVAVRAWQGAPTSEVVLVAAAGGALLAWLWQYIEYRLGMRSLEKRWSGKGISIYTGRT